LKFDEIIISLDFTKLCNEPRAPGIATRCWDSD